MSLYLTFTAGGRIGVLVEAETAVVNDAVKEALKNVAMQVAALNPKYVSLQMISAKNTKSMRKRFFLAQAKNDPKECQTNRRISLRR